MKFELPTQIYEKWSDINFMKLLPGGNELHEDGQTDMTKLIVAFRNFANVPEEYFDDYWLISFPWTATVTRCTVCSVRRKTLPSSASMYKNLTDRNMGLAWWYTVLSDGMWLLMEHKGIPSVNNFHVCNMHHWHINTLLSNLFTNI